MPSIVLDLGLGGKRPARVIRRGSEKGAGGHGRTGRAGRLGWLHACVRVRGPEFRRFVQTTIQAGDLACRLGGLTVAGPLRNSHRIPHRFPARATGFPKGAAAFRGGRGWRVVVDAKRKAGGNVGKGQAVLSNRVKARRVPLDCGSRLPLCCHSLLWSRGRTRQQAGGGRAAAGCSSPGTDSMNPDRANRQCGR